MSTSDNKLYAAPVASGNGAHTGPALFELDEPLTLVGETRYSQSLDRGLAIMLCFTPARPLLGIAELADMLGLSRSTTHRYVTTLVALGYLRQGERRKYRLALRVTELGLSAMNAIGLREHARPFLEELGRRSGHTVCAWILDGPEVVCVESVRARRGRRLAQPQPDRGELLPAYCTAAGKLLLAHVPEPERRALLAEVTLERHGPRTMLSKRALRAELEAIPDEGLAVGHEELAADILEIAAPVRGGAREVVAAVAMRAHRSVLSIESLVDQLGPHLVSTADRIGARLGYRRDDEQP